MLRFKKLIEAFSGFRFGWVLMMLALFAGLSACAPSETDYRSRRVTIERRMDELCDFLNAYYKENRRYPATLTDFGVIKPSPHLEAFLKQYRLEYKTCVVQMHSVGPDYFEISYTCDKFSIYMARSQTMYP